ncbi:MAG: hypothetical protein ORN57_01120 [Alphaproteobacteria bacterium]|nr:hypothetical protein [Alphaproteobacteria bacterium]
MPRNIIQLLSDKDNVKAQRAHDAMMQMEKFDMKKLQDAFDGR